jgi:hypothetical protein
MFPLLLILFFAIATLVSVQLNMGPVVTCWFAGLLFAEILFIDEIPDDSI